MHRFIWKQLVQSLPQIGKSHKSICFRRKLPKDDFMNLRPQIQGSSNRDRLWGLWLDLISANHDLPSSLPRDIQASHPLHELGQARCAVVLPEPPAEVFHNLVP